MVCSRRLLVAIGLSLSLIAGWAQSPLRADTAADLAIQQERQKQIQADTDSMVRRLGTMLRVLDYYQVDKTGERKMLEEMAGVLSGLSANQMAEVIRRLEAAAAAKNDNKTNEQIQQAYDRHREILDTLKVLLARHDAIGSLDQAAERLDNLGRGQLELHFQSAQLIRDSLDQANLNLPPTQRLPLNKRRNLSLEPKRQSDAQSEIHQDLGSVVQQVAELMARLPEEQKQRVRLMRRRAAELRVVANLAFASNKLKSPGTPVQKLDAWQEANETQWEAAGQIKELARLLRGSSEALAVLREARDRVEQVLVKQDQINKETELATDKEADKKTAEPPNVVFPDTTPLPVTPKFTAADRKAALEKAAQDAFASDKVQELSKEQARAVYDAKDARDLVKAHAEDVAGKIAKAELAMNTARVLLRKNQPKNAAVPQDQAVKGLQEVKDDLDKLIAAAEAQKSDPLAALKKTAGDLDDLIKDQATTRDQTKDAANAKDNPKMPELAQDQRELANRADNLKDTPLPASQNAKAALDEASKAMNKAAKELKNQKADQAVPMQEQALAALEKAKKELAAKVAELEKRKDDIAKLEDAAKKLAEITKAEKNIAAQAKDMAAKPEQASAKDLAKNQAKLTPEAKELAKNVEPAAPDAASKVNEGTKNMDAAKKELDKNQANPAAAEAKEAAKKLEQAQAELAKALDDLKAKDIADRAAIQPNKLDPQAAAQLLAKALEQTEQAERQARDAQALARQKEQVDLIRLQENIAKQAGKMTLDDAAADASKAAQALRQAEIAKAIANQEGALAKLLDGAQKPLPATPPDLATISPKPGPEVGGAKSSGAKSGDPQASEAKTNQVQPGDDKAGEKVASAGAAKTGVPKGSKKAAETKSNQAQAGEAKMAPKAAELRARKTIMAKPGEPKGEPQAGQAKSNGDLKAAELQAKANPARRTGENRPGQTKPAQAKAASAKAGEAMQGETKMALAEPGTGKTGQGTQGYAKAGDPGYGNEGQPEEAQAKTLESTPLPQAKNPAELAQLQKEVLDATKALMQSQNATQAAMAALGQAQAQAPKTVQKQLRNASQQLAKANQNLQKGKPAPAGQNQAQAAKELSNALGAMDAAAKAMGKAPGKNATAQAKAGQPGQQGQDGQDGMGEDGMGQEGQGQGKEGQAKAPGQGKGKQGPGQEKNENMGNGDRTADGKTSNAPSRLTDAGGDGSFLHLPPRQRELIRQALSGQLPPEYAAMIQQYFVNIARGRAVPGATPAMPAPNR